MASTAAGIIFSSLNDNTLSRLTNDRTVAAIPFACRYRLVDFSLSNLVNANISNISIVANYNYRSLAEHVGSGKDWDLARRAGGVNFVSPFQSAYTSSTKMFTTKLEALINMKEYINEFKEEYVVLMDSSSVLNIDINDVIREHELSGAETTIVTRTIEPGYTSKRPRMMVASNGGRITDMTMCDTYTENTPELSIGIIVISTAHLRVIIEEAAAHNLNSFTAILLSTFKTKNYHAYNYSGYVATVSSFLDYYKNSILLAKDESARESLLWKKESPIFTRVHNSSPVIYKDTASVEGSMIADDCVIEGTVINSVLFRGVHVARGAVVKDSVLFSGTRVGKDSSLNCIVTDKDVLISDGVVLSGNENMPFYVQKRRRV